LLRVEPKKGDRNDFIAYTQSWLNPAEQEPEAKFTPWSSNEEQPSSSVPAQVAFKAVRAIAPDRAMDYHRRLLRGYFTENRNIADSDVLLELATDIGIDRDALTSIGSEQHDRFTQQVIEEHNEAIQSEVTAVPTVVFEGSFAVPGAQPVDTYVQLVERIEEKKRP
jgi:predicted DsbA family dithiol-disulfide isomerase